MEESIKYINPYKQFNGIFIPDWLLEREEILIGSKICYARLTRYAGKNGYCYPKIDTLAKEIGVSVVQCKRYIKELKDHKLIAVKRRGFGNSNVYYFCHHDWMIPQEVSSEIPQEVSSKIPLYKESHFNESQDINNNEVSLTDANEVLLHLIEVTGQDWKPNNKRFITEALKNGYTKEDLIEIIDLKQFQTEKINQAGRPAFDPKWMTPQTLFKNQVEKYHNEVQLIKQGKTKANPYETQQDRQQQKRDKLQELGVDPFELFGFKRDAEDNRSDVQ